MKTRIFYSLFVLLSLGNPILTESKKILNTKVVTQEESGLESQEKTVWVLNEFKTIRVLYKPEGKKSQFAKLVLETSGAYIPKLAEYLQAAPIAKVLTIRDLTDKTSARNEGSTVYLPFAFPDPELPILHHCSIMKLVIGGLDKNQDGFRKELVVFCRSPWKKLGFISSEN